MDRGPYMLGGSLFKTKGEIERLAKKLIAELPLYRPIPDEHAEFVLDLLGWHPEYEQKMRPGFVGIVVGENTVRPGIVARSFRLVFTDNTYETFSYKTCVRRKTDTPRQQFMQACRTAVVDSVVAYRDWAAIQPGPLKCEITGKSIAVRGAHVHHEGMRFAAIADEFIKSKGLDISMVEFKYDGAKPAEFADAALAAEWKQFHDDRAVLGIVAQTERH